ncbi:VOC family protein [Trinickia sp. NRRL B-1857]|uniref:VOC family protein n=1 Tax=Trinickia sp. NRRL B-1857 TaxID=3162879 RepID=UPI003D2A55DB
MTRHVRGIDHVVIAVRDLDAASEHFTRMGFALTPRGYHTVGSENHCAMFANGYLELLAVRTPHPVTAYFSRFLDHGDGAAAMVVATDNAQALHRDWRAAGVPVAEPFDFSRPVQTARGDALARFRITQVDTAYTPGGLVFACEHLTPELVYSPDETMHPNGATGLAAVTVSVASAQLEAVADRYARVLAASTATSGEAERSIRCGDVDVQLDDTASEAKPGTAPYVSALTFAVRSLDALTNTLHRNGVATKRSGDTLSVDGAIVHGVTLRFAQRGQTKPA